MSEPTASWEIAIEGFLSHVLAEKGLAPNTRAAMHQDLAHLQTWALARELVPEKVDGDDLRAFLLKISGRLQASSRARLLSTMRSFFRFLIVEQVMTEDPTATLLAPRRGRKLPGYLTPEQIARFLDLPDDSNPLAQRDRAILETLYSSGCRVGELCRVNVLDLDQTEGTLLLHGKGSKQRLVPVGGPCLDVLGTYLQDGRPQLEGRGPRSPALFLNHRGGRLSRISVWKIVKKRGRAVGLESGLSPHTFRHSYATHLLQGGADLRMVQELLGHADISTTEIYTHIDRSWLHDVWLQAHPRART